MTNNEVRSRLDKILHCHRNETTDVLRRHLCELLAHAFVNGAKWWEHERTEFTMWPSDQIAAYDEACRRFGVAPPTEEKHVHGSGCIGTYPDCDDEHPQPPVEVKP